MVVSLTVVLCGLVVAGCGHDTPAPRNAPAPTQATTAATTTATLPDAALPLCPDLDSGVDPNTTDCRLISHDRAGYTFIARYGSSDPVNHQASVTITVLGGDGQVRQTITDTMPMGPPSPPELRNLADDGRDQLVVPIDSTTGGVSYEIYRATDSAPDFVDAGQVQGLDEGSRTGMGVLRTPDGNIATMSKSGPADHYLSVWHFVGDKLQLVASVRYIYHADGSTPTCTTDPDDHGDSGLSDAEVLQRFCGVKPFPATPVA